MSDLKSTCEYQEARMEAAKDKTTAGSDNPRPPRGGGEEPAAISRLKENWDRRSLRRKNKERKERKKGEEEANNRNVS